MPPHLLRAEYHAGMDGRAATGAHAVDARLERLTIALAAHALWREKHLGIAVEHDEREVVVIGEMIDGDASALFRLLEFRALHRATAIEDDGEVHRRAPPAFRAFGVEVDLHDHFARAAGINVIALGRDAQRHVRRSHSRASKDAGHKHQKMDSFHTRNLPRADARCVSGVCGVCKRIVSPRHCRVLLNGSTDGQTIANSISLILSLDTMLTLERASRPR
jgi:hypothetical protein